MTRAATVGPDDLREPHKKMLVQTHLRGCIPRGAQVSVALALEDMGLATLMDLGSDRADRWRLECTDEGNALAQRLIDIEADEEQDRWTERDELRERRDCLKEQLAEVEKRLAVLEARS